VVIEEEISEIGHQVWAVSQLFSTRALKGQPHLKRASKKTRYKQLNDFSSFNCSQRMRRIKGSMTNGQAINRLTPLKAC
jgi:hypothetical protein